MWPLNQAIFLHTHTHLPGPSVPPATCGSATALSPRRSRWRRSTGSTRASPCWRSARGRRRAQRSIERGWSVVVQIYSLRPSSATRWASVVVAVVAPPDQDTDGHKPQTKTKARCKALIAPLTSFAFAPFPRFNRSVEVLPRRRMGRPGSVPGALLSPTSFGRRIPTTAGPGPAAPPWQHAAAALPNAPCAWSSVTI